MKTTIELPEGPQRRGALVRPALAIPASALEGPYEIEGGERELTLRDAWRILARHAWTITAITATVTLLVTAWLALRPDYYEAVSKVEIGLESANPRPNEDDVRAPMMTADPAYFSTQLQIIRSPMVLNRVVTALHLDQDPVYGHFLSRGGRKLRALLHLSFLAREDAMVKSEHDEIPLNDALDPAITAKELAEQERLEPYIEDLRKRLTVEPVKEPKALFKDTRLVSITFGHPSPVLAAKVSNAIADAMVQANEDRKEHAGRTTNKYLVHRIDELRTEIRGDEITLAQYSSQHQILSLDPAQNTAVDRLTSLNRQLVEAENARKLAEANYEEAKAPDAAAALAESDSKEIVEAQTKLADLRQKKAQLLVGATEKWPEVQEVQQQIAALENSITDSRNRAASVQIKNLQTKYRQELAHENAIRSAYQQQRAVTQTQNNAAVDYRLLQQQIESKKNLLNGYLKRLGENDVAQAAMMNNIRVVEYAAEPKRGQPDGPLRLVWVFLAFVLSLSFSIALAFLLEYVDDSLRSAQEVRSVLQLRYVGAIPALRSSTSRKALKAPMRLRLTGHQDDDQSVLLWKKNVHPLMIESYRRLRVSILQSSGEAPKSLLVVSSLIGEGKTTTAANLAASMAQARASVLVIDADTHRKQLSNLFDAAGKPGLGDLLTLASIAQADVNRFIVKHESGISVLPAGKLTGFQSEALMESASMRALLAIVEATYDCVIIDSPAITACADAIVLAKNVEGVLFVVEAGRSSREIVRYSQEALAEVGAQVLGVVLNRLPEEQYAVNYAGYYYQDSKAAATSA